MFHHRSVSLCRRLHIHRVSRLEVRIRHRSGTVMVGDEHTVQHSVAVAVEVVARAVEVVGLCPVVKVFGRTVRPGNEVVVHHVLIVVGSRVSADDAHAIVIDHIIIILQIALHLRVAALVVGPEAVVDGPVACAVGDRAKALWLNAFRVDAILPGHVVGILDVDIVPRTPRHRAVVHDEVLALVQRQRTLAAVHTLAATHTDVAHDDILRLRGDDTATIDGDALAWCRLSGNGDVAGNGDALARDVDDTTHIEHHKAVRLAHGIGQRACARRVQVRHMHHLTATAARCVGAISLGTRKGQLLCPHGASQQPR